ncbi:TlpA family protein disulfide reductase [Terricaulis sp.]|uniref:TlpA family protein disulfide reductase n=1 Tax=Terricaulis sp. TaxID=2768686 RepID=UPI0037847097
MSTTRRAVLAAAAAAAVASPAVAQDARPGWLAAHPGVRNWWDTPTISGARFLNTRLQPGPESNANVTVREWLGGRPTIVAVWATWCPPCIAEKRPEAEFSQRLENAGSRAQLRALLAYDSTRLPEAQQRLQSLGAAGLANGRALESAEQALLQIFGFRRNRNSVLRDDQQFAYLRTALPFTLLFDSDGNLLGQSIGMMVSESGRSYWRTQEAFALMRQLAGES